ncbi:uncharacterized protein LOC128243778 isoform X2 [Mya arenaria]|uniref:uncharacterized protein LOC128243778 isoform X2 n=1 Tax=Mya arenaria TaxID=6604 RepID=UPI0022E5B1B5|nr:uncharacterized protein LOC128243778 isoform X2 [Mya arenaria]
MSRRPHSDTKKRNQHTSRNMGNFFSAEEQATVKSSQRLASAQSNVSRDSSIEIGPIWIETINSLVDDHMKVAEHISRLEEELLELKKTYMTKHDEIITTAERIKRVIQEQNFTGSGEKSATNKPDNGAQSEHEEDPSTTVEMSTKIDELKRNHQQFEVLIKDQEHILSRIETEVDKHGDKIKEHEESINLLKEQHKQRKGNIRTQRIYIKSLQKDLNTYGKRITKIDTENKKSNKKSLKHTKNCKPSPPIDIQTEQNTEMARNTQESVKTKDIIPSIKVQPKPVQKKTWKYAFVLNKELTQAFQSIKSEKLGFFNSTADHNYFDEFIDILKEDVIGVSMHEYSPTRGISAFDRILVFGTCTLRVESDSNMALDKIPKEHRSKVFLVMFHKTAGSKTPQEVYMYTFKHAEVARELHVPFKLNS